MSEKANKPLSLSAFWAWVKCFFGCRESSKKHHVNNTRLKRTARFLEHCYLKDCEIEVNRKRLERYWKDISV